MSIANRLAPDCPGVRSRTRPALPRPIRLVLVALLVLVVVPAQGRAQSPVTKDLTQVSLEELMGIEITSASRKEQRVGDIAAAVFVISSDTIRRSGMTSIPDLLRMVPGVEVAQVNSNQWAVSVRGFNGLYANKLLVLVDGRSVYKRMHAGVLWSAEDLMIDDIDRIEVIRGPSAATWGANAVNGVINIVTKTTADTRGTLVRVDAGGSGEQATVRYGGTLGAASYRVYAQWTGRDESLVASGTAAGDVWRSATTGFRADWTAQPGVLLLEGSFTAGEGHPLWPNLDPQTAASQPLAGGLSRAQGGHLLGRWTRTRDNGASFQVQSFVDVSDRHEPVADYSSRTVDIDTQYHTAIGTRHDVVTGAGYRFGGDSYNGGIGAKMSPVDDRGSLMTAFIQDEIALFGKRVALTLASQAQYDSEAGGGLQPSARLMWKVRPQQRVWAAVSRALRTPSRYERGIHIELPPAPGPSGLPLIVTVLGNPDMATETLADAEAGYRVEIGKAASIDVTAFVGRYDHLRTQETAEPIVQFVPSPRVLVISQFGNQLEATTRGLEIAAHWAPVRIWRLDGSYTGFHLTPHLGAASRDPLASLEDGSAPRTQWQVRSKVSPSARTAFDVAVFRVGQLTHAGASSYTRADVSAEWRFTNALSVMAIGQNLTDGAHAEFAGPSSFVLVTEIPRSVSVRLRWSFR
jgi:iron complex outermembrane receptor protein